MKKKRKGTFFSTKGKISTGDWGKISGEMRVLDAPILRPLSESTTADRVVYRLHTPNTINKKLL